MRAFYTVISYFFYGLLMPWLALHPKLRAGFAQRFWLRRTQPLVPAAPESTPDLLPLRLWVHGSSAGDVLCQVPLVDKLRQHTKLELVVSAFTGSGVAMARQHFAHAQVVYQPLDLPGATRRAMQDLRPELLILERAEIWPALIHAAHQVGAKVAIVNGRISPSSLRPYQRLFQLSGPVLDEVDLFLMRDDDEASRIKAIGAAPERVFVTGNTKLDHSVQQADAQSIASMADLIGVKPGDPLWVAGSTHLGEEPLLLAAFSALRAHLPKARLLIAPRYVERAEEIIKLTGAYPTLQVQRRSLANPQDLASADVVVLDTMGELNTVYALARLAFVGGTLVPRGGQNMLEPARLGVPLVVGPYTEDAQDQLALLRDKGLFEIEQAEALTAQVITLMTNPDLAQAQGQLAAQAVHAGVGAAQRCAEILLPAVGRSLASA